jgi:hypothetical protein
MEVFMRKQLKILVGLALSFLILDCYAIQVNVQSSSKAVSALGFTVNNKSHGSAGSFYSKKDMPAGDYTFGVRVGGLMGTDVGCTRNGKEVIALKGDTTAVLTYNGQQCSLGIYPGVRN